MIELLDQDGRWVAEVRTRDRRGTLSVTSGNFNLRSEALAWATDREDELMIASLRDFTVGRLVMEWHDQRALSLRDTTVARESSMLGKHVVESPIATKDARSLSRLEATAFVQQLRNKDNGRGGPLSSKTCRHIAKAMRQSFDASTEIEVNPFQRVALPSLPDVEVAFLTRPEIDTLLQSTGHHRWGWAFALLLLTGIRRSEFCGLKWEHVDLEDGVIEIRWRRTTARSAVVEGQPKTRRARRRIPLDPLAISLLTRRAKERDEQRATWGPDWCADGDTYVWALEDGSLPHPDRLTSEFVKFSAAININSVGVHGLRHSFAAAAIAADVAPYSLSRALGHAQVGFTLTVYGHMWSDGLVDEFAKISRLLGTGGQAAGS